MNLFLAIIFGYLIGSLSPGYFFGRLIKHTDIRNFGNKNTGATNTYRVVGPIFGIITGIFDFSKSLLVYFLAVSGIIPFFLPLDPNLAILAGLAAVAGHIKPFYLQFRGGGGVASLMGLCLITFIYNNSIFALILIMISSAYSIYISKSLKFDQPLRRILKAAALILPLGAIWLPKILVISVITLIFVIFVLFDIVRFIYPEINKRYLSFSIFAKQKETRRLSGAVLFLTSSLLLLWLFPLNIAVLSLVCFIVGDFFAPLGKRILAVPLLPEKTIGGALIIILVTFVAEIFLISLTPVKITLLEIIATPVLIAVLDQFSFLMDDNLLVPIGTALILRVIA